jgi:hypothetical protein
VPACNDPNASILGDISLIGNKVVMDKVNPDIRFPFALIQGPRNITLKHNDITFTTSQ